MRYNVSKLLTNVIEITEEKYQVTKKFIFVHKIDKEDMNLSQNLEKKIVNNKMESKIILKSVIWNGNAD